MNSLSGILRANPGLIVGLALCAGLPIVLGLVALIMRSAGASLRPVVFMAVLMLPLAWVFLLGHLVEAREPGDAAEPTVTVTVRDGRFAEREKIFGAEIGDAYVRDAKAVFPEFFAEAEVAELGIVGTGETVVAAQFPTAEATQRASKLLWQTFQITNTSGDETHGWRGYRRKNSDYIELLCSGRHLFLWTAPTKDAAASRRAASFAALGLTEKAGKNATPLFPALQPLGTLFQPTAMKAAGVLLMVALYSLWFFKGAAWASSVPAVPGVAPLATADVAARLESINTLDVPFRIERGARPGEFFATWRYADAKWVDHAHAHGLRRTFRIGLALDESAHVVRATDYTAAYDWSAGGDGARIAWQAALGIVFFQTEQRRVFGLQLDEHGRFKPELSYSYKFNLQEMKSPLIDAVTRAGWTWRPVVWQGPVWLRWLTE
ncbi:MAG: hypothetical protein JNK23_22200 [Opitutaceae bacterium]|nr:hypothetical protein [Opitutaceae bacterium]